MGRCLLICLFLVYSEAQKDLQRIAGSLSKSPWGVLCPISVKGFKKRDLYV